MNPNTETEEQVDDSKYISIILPVYNEEDNIVPLYEELIAVLKELHESYEILFINDGSSDNSLSVIKNIQRNNSCIKIVEFRKRFGQTAALAAGFDLAKGQIVATLDADGQNDPADLPRMLDELDKGFDLVCGWRYKRKDNWLLRVLPSKLANAFISILTDIKLHDYGCTLKVMRAEFAKRLELHGEQHRLIPALMSWYGVEISEIKVNHRKRVSGISKYGMGRTFRVILDVLTVKFFLSYSSRPIQLFGGFGLLIGVIGSSILIWYAIQTIFFDVGITDRPILLLAILLVVSSLQFITFGLLAELQIRTHYKSRKRSIYVIKEVYETEDEKK